MCRYNHVCLHGIFVYEIINVMTSKCTFGHYANKLCIHRHESKIAEDSDSTQTTRVLWNVAKLPRLSTEMSYDDAIYSINMVTFTPKVFHYVECINDINWPRLLYIVNDVRWGINEGWSNSHATRSCSAWTRLNTQTIWRQRMCIILVLYTWTNKTS